MADSPLQPRVSAPGAGAVFSAGDGCRFLWLTLAAVCLGFAIFGAWRAPVPGVNEPHYLGKAKHFWNPGWCGHDLLLQSANAHGVFYATVGWLTRVLPFEEVAWIGRGLVWGFLAAGWVALTRQCLACRWGPIWAAAFFLALAADGNLSGEWLIGGVEAKGFAYACLLFGVACGCRDRWMPAAAWCGAAVSFHPVVGGWGVIAFAFARIWQIVDEQRHAPPIDDASGAKPTTDAACPLRPDHNAKPGRAMLRSLAALFLMCAVFSLPGLIPAIAMLVRPVPVEIARAADEIQVFDRLNHHLDPTQFSVGSWCMYAALLAALLALRPWRAPHAGSRLFFRFVVGTLLIAAGGMAAGFGPRWAGVVKFYPFRLADVFLPIALSLEAARRPLSATRLPSVVGHALALAAFAWALAAPDNDRNPTGWTEQQRADWLDVCHWIADHTPADALCLTPRWRNYTFKWHAGRAEYATWKDCPQDAASLVEWKRRLDFIEGWRTTHGVTGFTASALAELRRTTDVDYVVDWYIQPYRIEPAYRNRSFLAYDLTLVVPASAGIGGRVAAASGWSETRTSAQRAPRPNDRTSGRLKAGLRAAGLRPVLRLKAVLRMVDLVKYAAAQRPSTDSQVRPVLCDDPALHLPAFIRYQEAEIGMAKNSVQAYRSDLQQFFEWFGKQSGAALGTVDLKLLSRYLQRLHERGLAATSVSRHLVAIKMFFRFLVLEGVLRESVVDLLNSPNLRQHLPHVLSPDMVNRLLAAPQRADRFMLRDRALLALLYATGCRASEVVHLKMSDLHLDETYCRCIGKGNKERLVSLNPVACRAIEAYLEHERPLLAGRSDADELLISKSGRSLTRIMVWMLVKKYARRIGASAKVSPHTLRHSFATHLLAGGAEIRALQELLGHASIATTQIYTHVEHTRLKAVHRKCHPRG